MLPGERRPQAVVDHCVDHLAVAEPATPVRALGSTYGAPDIDSGGSEAFATASRIATSPSSTADRVRNAEPNLPTGVLSAETMTERCMGS